MSDFVDKFLMKSILGRDADPEKSKEIIMCCIKKAYNDMLTAGRFYKIGDKESNCKKIYEQFDKNKYCFSKKLIKETQAVFYKDDEKISNPKIPNSYVTAFGLAQKVVNMTFKYLYCFREFTGLDIDFTKCDCPIDSIVLSQMKKEQLIGMGHSYIWSKLDESQYDELQAALNNKSFEVPEGLPICSPKLLYDFHVW